MSLPARALLAFALPLTLAACATTASPGLGGALPPPPPAPEQPAAAVAVPPARPVAAPHAAAPGGLHGAPPLTLAAAESRLIERNLSVVAARRGVDIARAQRLIGDNPPQGSVGFGTSVGELNEDRRAGGYYGARLRSPVNNLDLNLAMTFERGGKQELRVRQAEAQVTAAEAQVLDSLRGQVFQLRQAFIQGLQARANLQVAIDNRASLNSTEALLARQVSSGALPESELLRFQASRLPFEQDVANTAQAYVAAAAQVAQLLGEDAVRPAAPPSGRRGDPAAQILAGLPFDLQGRLADHMTLDISRETLAEAVAHRPDVVAAERSAGAAEANIRLQEAGRSRDVTLSLDAARTELSQNLPNASRNIWANNMLGLSLSVPIFTRGIVEGNVALAQAQHAQANAQAEGVLAQARADFATAWASYEQARSLLDLTTVSTLRRAEEAYRSTQAAYLAGGRSLLDALDALRTLNATRVAANGARAACALALAQLEQASGVSGLAPRL